MNNRLDNIQGLRAIAVIAVVMFHVSTVTSEWGGSIMLKPFEYFGFAGVDLFFVISGFIMVAVHRNDLGETSYRPKFVFKRIWRIFPAYWIVWAIAALVYVDAYRFPPPCYSIDNITTPLIQSFFLLPSAYDHCFIPQAWTLNYEMYFYLTFAIVAFLPRRMLKNVFIAWCVLSIAVTLVGPKHAGAIYRFSAINLYFLSGCGLALIPRESLEKAWVYLGLFGVLFWFWSAREVAHEHFNPGHIGTRFLHFGIASVLIVAAAVGAEGRLRVPEFVIRLGDASYAIYLLHMVVMIPFRAAVRGPAESYLSIPAFAALFVFLSIYSGLAFNTYIERPLLRLQRYLLPKQPAAGEAQQAER